MKPYIRELTSKQLKRLGWQAKKGESHFERLLRPTILHMASLAEEPSVIKEALNKFAAMKKPRDIESDLRTGAIGIRRAADIDPDLRGVVYGTAVRHGGRAEFDKLLAMHRATSLSEERNVIASAMTGFKQPALIKRSLDLVISKDVRKQDIAYWIVYSFMNRHARRATWEWLKDNWGWLEKNLGSDLAFYRMPVYAARPFSERVFLQEFTDFFDRKTSPALQRSINQGKEIIQWQSDWKERDLKLIQTFFKNKSN